MKTIVIVHYDVLKDWLYDEFDMAGSLLMRYIYDRIEFVHRGAEMTIRILRDIMEKGIITLNAGLFSVVQRDAPIHDQH